MKKEILAQFDYNGKTFVYYILPDKPQDLLYGYLDNGEINSVISQDIIEKMKSISSQIFISSNPVNHVKLTKIKLRSKMFQIMYDKCSKLKFFYEIKDNNFYLPDEDDAIILSNMYNRQVFYIFKNITEENGKKIVKIMKKVTIYGAIIDVILISALIFTRIERKNQSIVSEQTITTAGESYTSTPGPTVTPKIEFSLDQLLKALDSNLKLSTEEKEFFADILVKLQNYGKYMDMGTLLQKLSTLEIEYSQSFSMTGGVYNYIDNKIIINAYDFNWCKKDVLTHEFLHFLSNCDYSVGYALEEAATQNMTSDILNTSSGLYLKSGIYLNILCEIIGPEPFAAFHFSGDISYVINALKDVIPDEDLAFQLLSSWDDFHIQSNFMVFYGANPDYPGADLTLEERQEVVKNSDDFIFSTLSKYFLAAKGYTMEEDVIIRSYTKSFNRSSNDIYISTDNGTETLIPKDQLYLSKNYFFGDDSTDLVLRIGTYLSDNNGDRYYSEYKYLVNDANRRLLPSTINDNALVLYSDIIDYQKNY